MSPFIRPLHQIVPPLFMVISVLVFGSLARAADADHANPIGKLYVADVEGVASATVGNKIEDMTPKSVYNAEGIVIETAPESTNAVVFSNGTGIAIDPDTRLEVRRFIQEPFPPDHTDLDIEPSVSQTTAFLPRGTVGLCTSKLVAGSTMTYSTRHASVAIRGRKVVIETSDNQTIVSLLEGDVTVGGDQLTGGLTLKPGQQAIVTRKSSFEPPVISIQPIPQGDMKRLDEKAAIACMARKTVSFYVAEGSNSNEADVIVPVEVLPGTLSPELTISPFNIPAPVTP